MNSQKTFLIITILLKNNLSIGNQGNYNSFEKFIFIGPNFFIFIQTQFLQIGLASIFLRNFILRTNFFLYKFAKNLQYFLLNSTRFRFIIFSLPVGCTRDKKYQNPRENMLSVKIHKHTLFEKRINQSIRYFAYYYWWNK